MLGRRANQFTATHRESDLRRFKPTTVGFAL
jgi:hypothetical protein